MTKSMIIRICRRVDRVEQRLEVLDGADVLGDGGEVGDVVAAVAQRRREERRQPDAVDAEPLEVVQPVLQPAQVADAVSGVVLERADQDLVEHGTLEPVRVVDGHGPSLASDGSGVLPT